MTTPSAGATLSGSSQTFAWTAGTGVSSYWLYAGTSPGGNNLFDQNVGSSLTATITNLPANGSTIYVRLWWNSGWWSYADYKYTAANTSSAGTSTGGGLLAPALTTPTPGTVLSGSTQTFSWTTGSGIAAYWLSVGTSPGRGDLFDQSLGLGRTATVTGLPTNGGTVYVRLWWLAGSWGYADYTYIAANAAGAGGGTTGSGTGSGGVNPVITTPTAGATLTGSTQTFTWTAGSGASSYWLYLGRTLGGNDLFDRSMGTALSVTAAGLPTDGRTVYARLWWLRSGGWEHADSAYTATVTLGANKPPVVSLMLPVTGSTFTAPATIGLNAVATDADGSIQKVEFYNGTVLIGAVTTSPYTFIWLNVPAGTYSVSAVARDNVGATSVSSWSDITVTAATSLSKAIFTPASVPSGIGYYLFEVFAAGADPRVARAVAALNLGLPEPVNGEISVDVRSTITALAPGSYIATVSAVSAVEGTLRSAPFAFTR